MDNPVIRKSVESSISSFRDHPEPKPAYTEYILRRKPSENESAETTTFWKVRLKLVDLLQSGLNYDAVTALDRIEKRKDLLLAELVILYGRVYYSKLGVLMIVTTTRRSVEVIGTRFERFSRCRDVLLQWRYFCRNDNIKSRTCRPSTTTIPTITRRVSSS
jgi:hypothetical protein